MAKEKRELPAEHSIALRVICCIMAIMAIGASFVFGESPVPSVEFNAVQGAVLVLCIWLCIGGGVFSYHYRDNPPAAVSLLMKLGAGLILTNLARELFEANVNSIQFEYLRPLMHALVAAAVLTSFEMRTRHDIISSATFGLLLLCVAASSGQSLLFGGLIFLYICFGTALLMLSCQSQTRNDLAAPKRPVLMKSVTRRSVPIAPVLAMLLLPTASVALFAVMPRLDNEADSVSAEMRATTTSTLSTLKKRDEPAPEVIKERIGPNRAKAARIREALRQERIAAMHQQRLPEPPKQKPEAQPKQPPPKAWTPPKPPKPQPTNDTPPPPEVKQPQVPNQPPPNNHDTPPKNEPPKDNATMPPADPGAVPEFNGSSQSDSSSPPSNSSSPPKEPKEKPPEKNSSPKKPKANPSPGKPKEKPNDQRPKQNKPLRPMDDATLPVDAPQVDPEREIFTLACSRSVYTKSLVMDLFDGTTWHRRMAAQHYEIEPTDKGVNVDSPPLSIPEDLPIMQLVQKYKIENDIGFYIPVAGIPQTISLLWPVDVDWLANIRASNRLVKGTEYSVVAQYPVYSLDTMRKVKPKDNTDPPFADEFLQTPDNQSAQMFELSEQLVGEDGNRFVKAERILNHLRKNYEYSPTPVPSDDPNANAVDVFLFDKKKGDCKAYASAFVMLCRAAEIPARLVVGYLPGEFDAVMGVQHVKQKHMHAWGEAWIPPYGWVPFDPSPNGLLPARPEENYYNAERIVKEVQTYYVAANKQGGGLLQTFFTWSGYAFAAAGLAWSLFALWLGLKAMRGMLRNLATQWKNRHPASAAKRRVIKRLAKLGLVHSSADTGADLVNKLQEIVEKQNRDERLTGTVADFMDVYNATYFGRENRLPELKSLEAVIGKMCAVKKAK